MELNQTEEEEDVEDENQNKKDEVKKLTKLFLGIAQFYLINIPKIKKKYL